MSDRGGGLAITALYTSQVWAWAGFPDAELLATRDGARVFAVTNAALALARKPPLTYSLAQRHAMLDHLADGAASIVELGAGLSRRGVTLSRRARYVELDVPDVIAHKRALLERTPAGRDALARLQLVAGDALATPLPVAELAIAEGLVVYLAEPARRALFARVAATGARFAFDLTPADEEPPPGLAGRALAAAMKRFTGGRTFERDARTRAQILAELADAGFAHARAIAAPDVARAWQLPHADRVTATVVFEATRA